MIVTTLKALEVVLEKHEKAFKRHFSTGTTNAKNTYRLRPQITWNVKF